MLWLMRIHSALFALTLLSAEAWAEESAPSNGESAQAAMQEGIAALSRGEARAALSAFRRAALLAPDAPLPHRYEAQALESLNLPLEAASAYEVYLRLRPDARDATAIVARIAELRKGPVKDEGILEIVSSPNGVAVLVDDVFVGVTPQHNLEVKSGVHSVVLRKEGTADAFFYATVPPMGRVSFQWSLEAEPIAPVASGGGTQKVVGLSLGAVGFSTALVGGLFFGLRAASKRSDADAYCSRDSCFDLRGVALDDEARSLSRTANILVGVGAATLMVGAALFLTSGSKASGGHGSVRALKGARSAPLGLSTEVVF